MAINSTRLFFQLLALWVLTIGLFACQADNQRLAETSHYPSDSRDLAQKTAPTPADSVTSQSVVTAYPYSIPPVDDTKRDPALRAFVQQVIGYAKKHQLQQLLAVADDSIAVSYGGGLYGKKEFEAYLAESRNDGYEHICRALALGGAIDKNEGRLTFYFPYLQAPKLLPKVEGEFPDPIGTWAGLNSHVCLYEKPDKQSKLLLSLPYPILYSALVEGEGVIRDGWLKVGTVDDKTSGYTEAASLYELASMLVLIERKRGTYKITSVAPFD